MFVPLSVVLHHLNAETRQPLSAHPLNGLISISEECAAAVACASVGLGIATVSMWMCASELASGQLVEILADYRLDPTTATVVFPAGRRPSQKARARSDYLEHALATADEARPSPPAGKARLPV